MSHPEDMADAIRSAMHTSLGVPLVGSEPPQWDKQNGAALRAMKRHGHAKIEEASLAFMKALDAGHIDKATYQSVVGAGNRFDAVVAWYEGATQ